MPEANGCKCKNQSRRWVIKSLDESEIMSLPVFELRQIKGNGTAVIWQEMDRIEGDDIEIKRESHATQLHVIRLHLELVFHRFMASGRGASGKTRIYINNKVLTPRDPFMETHDACQILNSEDIILPANSSAFISNEK